MLSQHFDPEPDPVLHFGIPVFPGKTDGKSIAKIATVVEPALSMPEPWHYRNKVTWHMAATGKQEPVLGFFREAGRQLVSTSHCWLIPEKRNG